MPYDRYQHWVFMGQLPPRSMKGAPFTLKERVLLDLEKAPDHIDELEILDSFEAAVQREYGLRLVKMVAEAAGLHLGNIVAPVLASLLRPLISLSPIVRARAAGAAPTAELEQEGIPCAG